jgi:arylsulfatase
LKNHTESRPNIVVVLADDLGYSDIGCYGAEIATPSIDSLAATGVRFTNFYNSARCCPTRASLLTGCYPHQVGIGHMTAQTENTRDLYGKLELPAYRGMIGPECVTVAEVLRAAGYQTLLSGKWHAGQFRPQWPVDRGFDRFYGLISGGCNYFSPEQHRLFVDQEERVTEFPGDFYITDAFSNAAVRFIDEAEANRPFFLYLAYTAPHWPLHAWPDDIEKYRGSYRCGWDELRDRRIRRQQEIGLFGSNVKLSARDPECSVWESTSDHDLWDLRMSIYAAQIDRMDQGIGKVLDALRRKGIYDNTIVMFLSDNGACAETIGPEEANPLGERTSFASYMLPWANASNTPFRLFKHWTHEGGIATPFVVSWPELFSGMSPAIDHHRIGHVKDIMATCMELAGAEYPEEADGRSIIPHSSASLVPAIRAAVDGEANGRTASRSSPGTSSSQLLQIEHEGNRAVRLDNWKLVSFYTEARGWVNRKVGRGRRTGAWELYDLSSDRTEETDLSADEPQRLREMIEIYDEWAAHSAVVDWETVQRLWGNINDGDP